MPKTPDFLIVGGMKCGTTSLHNWLKQHPEVRTPQRKELHFFDTMHRLSTNKNGVDWYLNQFEEGYVTGETTPSYLLPPYVPAKVKKVCGPNVKIIVLLRNPVDRAFSHYLHCKAKRWEAEPLDLLEALKQEQRRLDSEEFAYMNGEVSHEWTYHSYQTMSRYAPQIANWYSVFPTKNVFIACSEFMFNNPDSVFKAVCEFLNIKPITLPEYGAFNVTRNKDGNLSDRIRRWLESRLSSSVTVLRNLLKYSPEENGLFTWNNWWEPFFWPKFVSR